MDLAEALERIDAIHGHLARGEQYRGYRPAALALSGVAGLGAALVQPLFVDDPLGFVAYWVVVAVVCGAVAGAATVHAYLFREDDVARRRTRVVLRQFVPCLVAGGIVTAVLVREPWRASVGLLPGLWAILFSLGIVASLPYLPRLTAVIAAWYFLAGVVLFSLDVEALGGWAVGVPFGLGQLFSAVVLHRDRLRGARA